MAYNDPYANNAGYGSGSRYQAYDQTNHNAPYYSNQDYDSTGPTYDPYTNNPPYTRAGNTNVRFDDDQLNDVSKEEDRGPPVPNKYDDHESGALARQRSTRTAGASLKSKDSLKVSVVPARKHWNGFEHGEFTPTVPARGRGYVNWLTDNSDNILTPLISPYFGYSFATRSIRTPLLLSDYDLVPFVASPACGCWTIQK